MNILGVRDIKILNIIVRGHCYQLFLCAQLGRYSSLVLYIWGALVYTTAKIADYFPI
jgi:hypothetical protein